MPLLCERIMLSSCMAYNAMGVFKASAATGPIMVVGEKAHALKLSEPGTAPR